MDELDQQLESAQRYLEEEIKAADHLKAEIGRVKTIKSTKSAEIVSVSIKQGGRLPFFLGGDRKPINSLLPNWRMNAAN